MSDNHSTGALIDIYHKVPLQTRTDEHILQASLGCEAKSRQLIDHATNTQFGATINRAVGDAFTLVRTLLGFEGRRGAPLTTKPSSGDYLLGSEGKPGLRKRRTPWEVETGADGRKHFTITAPNIARAQELMKHAIASEGFTLDDVKDVEAYSISGYAPQMQFQIPICDRSISLALAKAVFNLFAYVYGNDLALTEQFDELRHWILQDEERDRQHNTPALRDLACWEMRDGLFTNLPSRFATVFQHKLVVRASTTTGVAYGLVELFGHLRYSVLLSERWTGDDVCAGLFADPTIGNQRHKIESLNNDCCPPLLTNEVLAHEIDAQTGEDRLGALMRALRAGIEERQYTEMATAALAAAGLSSPDGHPISHGEINRLAHEVAGRFVKRQFRLATKTSVDLSSI